MHAPAPIRHAIELPPSKSMEARALIINAMRGMCPSPPDPADCDDVRVLRTALRAILSADTEPVNVNLDASGTAMRLLTPFAASRPGLQVVLEGCPRLRQRPMKPLLNALLALGARCFTPAPDASLPLRIEGTYLRGGTAEIEASVSSQFVSALLLAAPAWERGLTLHLTEAPASQSYIDLTVAMMRAAGADVAATSRTYTVAPRMYAAAPPAPEPDWSAAAAIYEAIALAPAGTEITIRRLTPPSMSLQGDARCADLFGRIGVETDFNPDGSASLRRVRQHSPRSFQADMRSTPDLVPSLAAALALRGIPFEFTGIGHLQYKESDRIRVLSDGLSRFRPMNSQRLLPDSWSMDPGPAERYPGQEQLYVAADHRIAMALAAASVRVGTVEIDDPQCVRKSFPGFFQTLEPLLPR